MTKDIPTSHGHLVASILAYDMLTHYLMKELRKLERKNFSTDILCITQLHWTESKASLTELVYALYSTGAINNGKAEIGEIALAFEAIFNVDLNNYYRSYMEIKIRKSNRTKFLAQLKEKLIKKMNEDDIK